MIARNGAQLVANCVIDAHLVAARNFYGALWRWSKIDCTVGRRAYSDQCLHRRSIFRIKPTRHSQPIRDRHERQCDPKATTSCPRPKTEIEDFPRAKNATSLAMRRVMIKDPEPLSRTQHTANNRSISIFSRTADSPVLPVSSHPFSVANSIHRVNGPMSGKRGSKSMLAEPFKRSSGHRFSSTDSLSTVRRENQWASNDRHSLVSSPQDGPKENYSPTSERQHSDRDGNNGSGPVSGFHSQRSNGLETNSNHDLSLQVRSAMRLVPHPVAVITTSTNPISHPLGSDHAMNLRGMTISSFTSVTLSPVPIISFNIRSPSSTLLALRLNGYFLLNILSQSEAGRQIANAFTKGNGGHEISENVFQTPSGAYSLVEYPHESHDSNIILLPKPSLPGGVVMSLYCKVLTEEERAADGGGSGFIKVGDHTVVLSKVIEVKNHSEGLRSDMCDVEKTLVYQHGDYAGTVPWNSLQKLMAAQVVEQAESKKVAS
jgi:flavin reductase (DIM6/NTAB) family NADH-FMN oxidoreductase RutF